MRYRIEIGGRGGEVVIGRVKREFYELFNDDETELDLEDYVWNFDFFEENEDVEIPEDIRPFAPGEWYDCDDIAHECGVSVDSLFLTVTEDETLIIDNAESDALRSRGVEFETVEEIDPQELAQEGETFIQVHSYEKGFFFSYEFEADVFDITKLSLSVTDVDGWEIITGVKYNELELEDLGELSTSGKGSDAWLGIVEKD
jgi:hypothetical protein